MAHVASDQASPSLLEKVMKRGNSCSHKHAFKVVQWGTEKEQQAVDMLVGALSEVHVNLRYERAGLVTRQEETILTLEHLLMMSCSVIVVDAHPSDC